MNAPTPALVPGTISVIARLVTRGRAVLFVEQGAERVDAFADKLEDGKSLILHSRELSDLGSSSVPSLFNVAAQLFHSRRI